MRSRTDGFTLVELMVVVLILGILVAIAVPVYNAATDRATKAACASNQRIIVNAVEAYRATTGDSANAPGGGYFGPVSDGSDGSAKIDAGNQSGWYSRLVPAYIKSNPRCPAKSGTASGTQWVRFQWYEVLNTGTVSGCEWEIYTGTLFMESGRHSNLANGPL